jgi:hypothetical protein
VIKLPKIKQYSANHQEIDPNELMQLATILLPLALITAFLVSLALLEF